MHVHSRCYTTRWIEVPGGLSRALSEPTGVDHDAARREALFQLAMSGVQLLHVPLAS
jgi:hypothetical protein